MNSTTALLLAAIALSILFSGCAQQNPNPPQLPPAGELGAGGNGNIAPGATDADIAASSEDSGLDSSLDELDSLENATDGGFGDFNTSWEDSGFNSSLNDLDSLNGS